MSILGNRVLRTEDPKFLTTGGTYVDDVAPSDALHVTYVRATVAHARITSIDTTDALAAPGVVAVITAADVDLDDRPPSMGMLNQGMIRPWLARDMVRFVGEPVAAVITDEHYQGEDAAEMVFVDYDFLPAIVDPEAALNDADLVHVDAKTNVVWDIHAGKHEADFDSCDVVVSQRVLNPRVAPAPMEVRAAAAKWEDGRLIHWATCQGAHPVRDALAGVYGLDKTAVRVIAPDVGGGFGAKGSPYPEELFLGWISKRLERPIRWVETRTESMLNMGHGRGQIQDLKIGGKRDGTITAYELAVVQDSGAYPLMGAVLPWMTRTMLTGVYGIRSAKFSARSVATNTTPTTAYRGAGRPEAAAAIERAVDLFAAEIGIDPAEVRRRNLIPADAFPYETAMGTTYDCGNYVGALDAALAAADYDALRKQQAERRASGDRKQMGIGLSVYVEITGGGPSEEFAGIEVKPDGSVLARTGTSPHGQGHATVWAMLISERLGIAMDRIEVIHGDTDIVPQGGVTGGSRSLQVGGVAMHQAAGEVSDIARQIAADLLEAAPDDVVLDTTAAGGAKFHVVGTPAVTRTWEEVAAAAEGRLAIEHVFQSTGATFPSGAHVAVVDVDTETGKVELVRFVACDDAGKILNPLLAEGQVHGGVAQGAAQALLEEFQYDGDGNPLTANLADYAFISAAELPFIETVHLETPTPLNELGAKGIGESGTIGATPAVQNAVVDALAHLGVRHVDMPCTPERVWQAITAAKGDA